MRHPNQLLTSGLYCSDNRCRRALVPPELMCCASLIPTCVFLRCFIVGAGFFGLLDDTQEVLREMLPVTVQPHAWSSGVSQHNTCKSLTLM